MILSVRKEVRHKASYLLYYSKNRVKTDYQGLGD